jgi:hypothetical protein
VAGEWRGDTGGNRDMGTWINNPKVHFKVEKLPSDLQKPGHERYAEVFIGLYINDSRLTKGFDYYLVSN